MQRDRFAAARAWLRASAEDAAVAQALVDISPSRSAFHAQQAAESALKAAAIARSDDHQRTHSLRILVRELETLGESIPDDLRADAFALELLYTTTRYPDTLNDGDPADYFDPEAAQTALQRANHVLDFGTDVVDKAEAAEN